MAIEIKEYSGNQGLSVDWNYKPGNLESVVESMNGNENIAEDSIMVDIEGIHVGPTRNYTWYTENALRTSVPTWTKPYLRPLIMHHNEKDGRIIGRIHAVDYIERNTRSNTPALLFTTNVPDKEAATQVHNGILNTTSIGVIVHDARCSICGHNIAEDGKCEHERGEIYEVNGENKTCYWVINSMEAKELSYVIVPSDVYAHNVRIYKPTSMKANLQENLGKEVLNMAEGVIESKVIDENGDPIITPVVPAAPVAPPVVPEVPPVVDTPVVDTEEVTTLKATVTTLEAEIVILKADKETADAAKATALVDLEAAKVSLNTATTALKTKETEIATATSLTAAAEGEITNLKTEMREMVYENINALRTTLGKTIVTTEELSQRTEESLKDTIKDLKEEVSGKPNRINTTVPIVPNPTLVEELNVNKNVIGNKNEGNIDLKEQFEKTFLNMFSKK